MSTFVIIQLNPPLTNITTVNLVAVTPSSDTIIGTNIVASTLLSPTQFSAPDGTTSITVIPTAGPCIGTQFRPLPVVYPTTTTTTLS